MGYDSAKHTKGRKRHLLVDTLGLVVMVVVTAANVSGGQVQSRFSLAYSKCAIGFNAWS
jgi:transposase